MSDEVVVICLRKGAEKYVWLWHSEQSLDVLRSVSRMVADPRLSLTVADADAIADRVIHEASFCDETEIADVIWRIRPR